MLKKEAGRHGGLEAWNLEFGICFEFRIWDFAWDSKEIFPKFVNRFTIMPILWIMRF